MSSLFLHATLKKGMAMQCPRCGFSQPQDRFCAQCGLDVEAYQRRISLQSKWYKDPLTLLIGAVLLGTTSVFLLRTPIRASLMEKNQNGLWMVKGTGAHAQPNSAVQSEDPTSEPSRDENLALTTEAPVGSATQALKPANSNISTQSLASRAPSEPGAQTGVALPSHLKISFYEASTQVLESWREESFASGMMLDLPDVKAGILQSAGEKLKSQRHLQLLSARDLEINPESDLILRHFEGTQWKGQDVGMWFVVKVSPADNSPKLEIEIVHNLVENLEVDITKRESLPPMSVELPHGAAWFVVWTAPNLSATSPLMELPSTGFLKFLQSPRSRNRSSEMTITFELDPKI